MAYKSRVPILGGGGVMISVIAMVLQVLVVVESASRQEQEILLLDALSRKYQQPGPQNQYEANSIMDMLGRSTESLSSCYSLLFCCC